MVDRNILRRPAALWIGGAALLAAGAAGGAGAVGMTRPGVEVAPIRPVAIASLAQRDDALVTVRGKVAEVYGNSFTLADGSGKAMVDAGREGEGTVAPGQDLLVQGRYRDGQLHASFLVDGDGKVRAVGPMGPGGHRGRPGPEGPHGPGRDGAGRDGPPAGCAMPPTPVDAPSALPPGK